MVGPGHQVAQKRHFAAGQRDGLSRHPAEVPTSIQCQGAARHLFAAIGLHRGGAFQNGADARDQLGEGEGLQDVVVRPQLEPMDTIFDLLACCEVQRRRLAPRMSELLEDLPAVELGHHHIEQENIRLVQ